MIGHANSDAALRREIVQALFEILDGPREATRDLKVAAAISLGIVPIDPLERVGDAESAKPWDSRRDQIEALIAMHDAGKRSTLRDAERAHLGRSMARLCEGVSEDLRKDVSDSLIAAVGNRKRNETVALRQSAVLALGRLGDELQVLLAVLRIVEQVADERPLLSDLVHAERQRLPEHAAVAAGEREAVIPRDPLEPSAIQRVRVQIIVVRHPPVDVPVLDHRVEREPVQEPLDVEDRLEPARHAAASLRSACSALNSAMASE